MNRRAGPVRRTAATILLLATAPPAAGLASRESAWPLAIGQRGCVYPAAIERRLMPLRRAVERDERPASAADAAVALPFGPLHLVGLRAGKDAELREERLYFRDGIDAVRGVLRRAGWRPDRHGDVARREGDDGATIVDVAAVRTHPAGAFATARYYLRCQTV